VSLHKIHKIMKSGTHGCEILVIPSTRTNSKLRFDGCFDTFSNNTMWAGLENGFNRWRNVLFVVEKTGSVIPEKMLKKCWKKMKNSTASVLLLCLLSLLGLRRNTGFVLDLIAGIASTSLNLSENLFVKLCRLSRTLLNYRPIW